MMPNSLRGLFAAVLTPMLADGSLDRQTLASHCRNLLQDGCHGICLFGTTGEGPSLSANERMTGLETLLDAGIAPGDLLVCTGSAVIPDTVALTRHALENGCANVLIMPPFYFKNQTDDGVFAAFTDIIERVGDSRLRIYLYNFPAMTAVRINPDVVGRLIAAYPDTIAGLKDSSGEWDYVTELLQRFPGLAVFTGWEILLPKLLAAGGAGNISGLANVVPAALRDLYERRPESADDPGLARITRLVDSVTAGPIIPGLKALAATLQATDNWRNMRAPLLPLEPEDERVLIDSYRETFGSP